MPNNFHIIDFKKDNFYDIFLNDYNSLDLISSNIRCQYLYQYLNRLNCKKIVLETKYIDKDYLMDYQDFYVRCFKPYSKICKRALFFSFDLNIRFINNIINSASNSNDINKLRSVKKIRENYLGFMVIKPLPEKVVGKTCIRTFDSDQGKRKYYVVRPYHSNFYGINLDVNSLAFQEQDKIMAACSTISLWSAFQKTSNVFNHYLPSPGEITRNATNNNLGLDRTIPSKGLEIEQIVESIRHVGLTFEIKRVNELEMNQFLGFIHAYLKIGLPIILILKIPNGFGKNDLHAVTITGYRLENKPIEKSFNEIDLISDRISELYVHDDQMGPFSRIYLEKIDKDNLSMIYQIFNTTYAKTNGPLLKFEYPYGDSEYALPHILIIPLYHKIRINFSDILEEINKLNEFFNLCEISYDLEWDIHLSNSNTIKSDLLTNTQFSNITKKRILEKCMPKYIWRCMANIDEKNRFMEIISDSTDITSNNSFIQMIIPDSIKKTLKVEYPEIKRKNEDEIKELNIPNLINLLEIALDLKKDKTIDCHS